jgi:TolB-like protein
MLTPRYASPEHVKGEPITAASDVYSLGVILYELLTGCAVHRATGDSPAAILKAVCEDVVPPPSVAAATASAQGGGAGPIAPDALKGDLDRIALKALEKDPRRRYASVDALADDVRRHVGHLPLAARSPTAGDTLGLVRRHRPALTVSLLGILAVLLGVGFYRVADRRKPTLPAGRVMLAALPLENLTGSREQEVFIEGLHEEIISRLGRLQPDRLGVIARTSTLQFRDTTKSIAAIGGELGAHYILEGSVRQAGERVRVTAQLIQVSDQTQLWARTFEREIRDLFSVQVEIGADVADCLTVDVLPETPGADRPSSAAGPRHVCRVRTREVFIRRRDCRLRPGPVREAGRRSAKGPIHGNAATTLCVYDRPCLRRTGRSLACAPLAGGIPPATRSPDGLRRRRSDAPVVAQ